MDWRASEVSNYQLRWYERDTIRERKKSNRYTAFLRCACREYRFSNQAQKQTIIELVTGSTVIYPSDITCMALVKRCWRNMDFHLKEEWKLRAEFLNDQPRRGLFEHLPVNAPTDSNTEMRICCRIECDSILRLIRTHILKESIPPTTQNMTICFPQKETVGERIYVPVPMSAYVCRRIFGEGLANLPLSEKRSCNNKNDPGYIHLASIERAEQVLSLSDVNFVRYEDARNNQTILLTSTAILLSSRNEQSIKVYGWEETRSSITYIYFDDDDTPGTFITMPKPEFVVNNIEGSRRKLRTYTFPDNHIANSPYIYSEYKPLCIYVTSKRIYNVKILASRLCYRYVNNNYYFVQNKSS